MGMSASQARLLFITSRMNDIELKSQQISNTKIRLADESEQVANAYTKALNKTRLQITDPLTKTTSQLTYNSIMSPDGIMSGGYNLQTVDGKVVVSLDVAAAFERRRGNSYQAEDISSYQTNYNNAVSTLNKAEATLNNYLKSKDVTVNSDGTLKFPTKMVITTEGSSSTGGAGGAGGAGSAQGGGTVSTTDGVGSTGGACGAGGVQGGGTVPTTDGVGSTGGAGGAGGVQGGGTVPTADGVGSTGGAGGARAPRRIAQNPNSMPNDPTSINNNLTYSRTWSDTASPKEFMVTSPVARDSSTFTMEPTLHTGGGFKGWTTGGTTTGETTGGTTGRITDIHPKVIDLTPTGGTFTLINPPEFKPTIDESLRGVIVDVYSSAEKSQIQAQYNIYKQNVSVAKQAVSDAKTALDNAKAKNASVASNPGEYSGEFYENLFKQMETSGYKAYDQKLLNNPEALQAYLGNGDWCLGKKNADGKYAQTSISSSTMISEVTDKTDLAKAEAEYNAKTLKINNKEKKLDNQLKTLDTEHSALKTEQESIKSLIKENVDKSFNLFS